MDGQAKGWDMGGAVGRTATDEHDVRHLEHELRERLRDVDLICEADPPVALLDSAETECRRHFAAGDVARLADRSPATLAAYVAMRGAERYEGISLWPQLGVGSVPTSHVGQAFLRALRRMGLPDFQEMVRNERARTYVSPILIHGGIPAEHAHRLVERLEVELTRGLTGGSEAVRRLTTYSEGLGRPTIRLLRYVPDFASDLLDALIDQITGVEAPSSRRGIPRHLQAALDQGDIAGRRGLRRLRVPYVEFDDWAGYGPTVVCPDGAADWTIDDGDRSLVVAAGESVEIQPSRRLSVQSRGQRRILWDRPVLWFTDLGRLLPPDVTLPGMATVLLPRGWTVRDEAGREPPVVREGVGLSGAWSRHHALTVDLEAVATVRVVPPDDAAEAPLVWAVASSVEPTLVGDLAAAVSTATGEPVYRAMPRLRVSSGGSPIPVRFTSIDRNSRLKVYEPDDVLADGIDLGAWLGADAVEGRVEVRSGDGRRRELPLTVVPGLAVDGLDRPYAPGATGVAHVWLSGPHGSNTSVDVHVPALADQVACPPIGSLATQLRLDVPRVRWALRSSRPSRLELAPGTIAVEIDELLADDAWLLVRCGRRSRVVLQLYVDGDLIQVASDQETRRTGGRDHQCAFPLAPYGDTLRHHRDAAIELRCVVDAEPMPMVVCGTEQTASDGRSWRAQVRTAPSKEVSGPWTAVEWMASRRPERGLAVQLASAEARALADRVLTRLRMLDATDQLVTFVRLLGDITRHTGQPTGRPPGSASDAWGPAGHRWAALEAVGDELWRLQGVRYRQFAGKKLVEGLDLWFLGTREAIRRLDRPQREAVEQWTFGRLPPLNRIGTWTFTDWVCDRRPVSRGASGVDHLPSALLYHVLALAGGDEDAGVAVAAAADVVPAGVLELTAFLLEVARRGRQFQRPTLRELDDGDIADLADDRAEAAHVRMPSPEPTSLRSLEGCEVTMRAGELRIRPPSDVAPPALRLWSRGVRQRAVGMLFPHADHDELVARVPAGLTGPHMLTVADPRSVPLSPMNVEPVDLSDAGAGVNGRPSVQVSCRDLSQLDKLRSQAVIERVARAIEGMRIAEAPLDELFEDEDVATRVLVDYAHSGTQSGLIDRVGIAILPAAMLFSRLPLAAADGPRLRRTAPILWAALGPRSASQWCHVGWPNGSRFNSGSTYYDDVVVFSRKQSALTRDRPAGVHTARYETRADAVPDTRVRETVRLLGKRGVDATFVDLVVATYCALSVDAVTTEATQMLVAAHRSLPDTTTKAVLVGTALHLASASTNRGPA